MVTSALSPCRGGASNFSAVVRGRESSRRNMPPEHASFIAGDTRPFKERVLEKEERQRNERAIHIYKKKKLTLPLSLVDRYVLVH